MNARIPSVPDAAPPPMPPVAPEPRAPTTPGGLLELLLKSPASMAAVLTGTQGTIRRGLMLLGCGALFHAVYGFAVGLFGGWSVAAMTAVKAPLIAVGALALCLPSLYVFGAVGGAVLTIPQVFALGASGLAMIGLILIGVAPVGWLFSVSTANLPFIVVLAVVLWLIALGFAMAYVGRLGGHPAFRRSGGINFWFVVFAVVALQMTTCMRPLLTAPDPGTGWWTAEKKFFLVHWAECFEKPSKR